ncbi:peroxidase family protein [Neorhizobium galegae]|uniref:peroxidase family protein n=1 Tax=Neorhizobium galegae TaxID=399 RepID=UPI000622A084|nr:heme peroxidase family protein [Neorhizobium galegae]KAB1126813.1 heme peroxidase [Neorhizobium galegae]MCQ1808488.1 heme peroxidase family protein [Neorhizobium galegae]UIK06319.1 heme peroxidase family protein [Neorhizobium galegae]CDZ57298.1 Myeloperoxidase, thyroid peroxidase, cyclooxygenase catalytic domain [Neorhizobium galegae bv. orientalis]
MTEFAMHGHGVRGMHWETLQSLTGHGDPGKFGRMFPKLDPLNVDDDILIELARAMKEPGNPGENPDPAGDNRHIPAGFTYFGQFVDHDITLDTTPLDQQKADPLATRNFRSPALDLDSLYGDGPGIHPYLYQRDPVSFRITPKLLVGHAAESGDNSPTNPTGKIPSLPNDLPRNQVGHALIFDERNDENLLVAQTHLLMIKFHNAVVEWVKEKQPGLDGTALFKEARRIVTWHYQWIVLFDFVERLTEPGLVRKIKDAGRRYYRFVETPYMPAEFAAAAYRLGHSMVRETYSHNHVFHPGPGAIANGTLPLLFFFTGKSGKIVGELDPDPLDFPLNPQVALPSNWAIDWRRFFDIEGTGSADFSFNFSRRLDPFITPSLHELPGLREDPTETERREANLAFRNLRRGVQIGLPSGQDVCRAMGLTPMTPEQVAKGQDGKVAERHGLHIKTPLWYYVLKEAQHYHQGERLGPMASTIVAETFLGLVHGDHESFLWLRSNWKPELPGATAGHFTMADLIRFVGDINPIG